MRSTFCFKVLKGSVRLLTGFGFCLKTGSDAFKSKNSKKFKEEFHNHAKIVTFLRETDCKNTIFKISRPIRKRCFQMTQNVRQSEQMWIAYGTRVLYILLSLRLFHNFSLNVGKRTQF